MLQELSIMYERRQSKRLAEDNDITIKIVSRDKLPLISYSNSNYKALGETHTF